MQFALFPSVPPDRLTEPLPATAVAVPPQAPVRLLGFATTSPAGRVSVNAIPFSVRLLFGLPMLKVSVVSPFTPIDVGLKPFVMLGGVATVRLAEAVLPVPPLVDVTGPEVLV